MREVRYTLDLTLPYDNLPMTGGTQNQRFVWGNGLIAADGEERFFYLQDHLGSPIRLLGEDQNDTTLAYDEFGVPLVESGQNPNNPFGFTGYQADEVSGLYYAQARYYEAGLGRFGAQDTHWNPGNMIYGDVPAKLPHGAQCPVMAAITQSKNQYGYCINNPVGYIDRAGNMATVAAAAPPLIAAGPVGWIAFGVLTLVTIGVVAYTASNAGDNWTDGSSALQIPRPRGEVIPFPKPPPKKDEKPLPAPVPNPNQKREDEDVTLYRWGGNTPNTFTPRPCDDDTGLSVYSTPSLRGNNQVTTLNTLRAQGWNVVNDHGNHYLIMPPNPADMPGWQASKANYQDANGNVDSKKNVWDNPGIHPLTHDLHSAFVPINDWGK